MRLRTRDMSVSIPESSVMSSLDVHTRTIFTAPNGQTSESYTEQGDDWRGESVSDYRTPDSLVTVGYILDEKHKRREMQPPKGNQLPFIRPQGRVWHAKVTPGPALTGKLTWKELPESERTIVMPRGPGDYKRDITVVRSGVLEYSPQGRLTLSAKPSADYDPLKTAECSAPGINLARRNAVKAALPGIRDRWTLPLFVKELSDLPSLWTAAKRLAYVLARAPQLFRLIIRFLTGQISRRTLANNHLVVQFGLLPFIGDMSKLYDVMTHTWDAIHRYKVNEGQLCFVRCQEALRVPPAYRKFDGPPLDVGFQGADHFGQGGTYRNVWSLPASKFDADVRYNTCVRVRPDEGKYHLSLVYSYSMPWAKWLQSSLCWMDALGVNFSPAQFWAAVPFSFVVDWVAGVSQTLESVDLSWSRAEVQFHSSCESVVYDYHCQVEPGDRVRELIAHDQGITGHTYTLVEDTVSVGDLYTGRVYSRWPINGLPTFHWEGFRMPRGMQMLTSGVLVVQQYDRVSIPPFKPSV